MPREIELEDVDVEDVKQKSLEDFEKQSRKIMPVLPVKERVASFDEVELGYTEEMAIHEARRCLDCAKHPTRAETLTQKGVGRK